MPSLKKKKEKSSPKRRFTRVVDGGDINDVIARTCASFKQDLEDGPQLRCLLGLTPAFLMWLAEEKLKVQQNGQVEGDAENVAHAAATFAVNMLRNSVVAMLGDHTCNDCFQLRLKDTLTMFLDEFQHHIRSEPFIQETSPHVHGGTGTRH